MIQPIRFSHLRPDLLPLYIRLAALTLINATPLAAQEVKALEDFSSSYYPRPNN